MNIEEVSNRFCIPKEKLLTYERYGLFDCHKQPDGQIDYCEESLEYISLIELLLKAGLDLEHIRQYLSGLGSDKLSNEKSIKVLIRQRYALLDDIHDKEKTLSKLDFLISEAQKKCKGADYEKD